MRPDALFLNDIVEAADAIERLLAGFSYERFVADERTRGAVVYQLIIVGEAATRISEPLIRRYPAVPWRDARMMRNFIAHTYFDVDWQIVWDTATRDVPAMRAQVVEIIALEDSYER
jgi:uncharacterized protein with HEPN domain